MSHNRSTKAQKEYVRTIVHQLSLQRFSDIEIADYLAEKGIVLARNTVNGIKKQIEKQAAKWYIDLRESRYKYIANYKERLDSLLSYQKQLHEIISKSNKDENKIRAITALQSIEMDIFNLWKQLPNLDIQQTTKQQEQQEEQEDQDREERAPMIVDIEDINGLENEPSNGWHDYLQCDSCKRWWGRQDLLDYHKKKTKCGTAAAAATVIVGNTSSTVDVRDKLSQNDENDNNDDAADVVDGGWAKLQCPTCKQYFYNNFTLSTHKCKPLL